MEVLYAATARPAARTMSRERLRRAGPDVFANGLPAARLGDAVVHDCPHCGTGHISSASETVFANGIGAARIGDAVTYPGGGGFIAEGSADVPAGG